MESKIEEEIEIRGPLGLHARPAAKLAKALAGIKAEVRLGKDERWVDARSILDVLTLAASGGTKLKVQAEGEEARKAVETVKGVLEAASV